MAGRSAVIVRYALRAIQRIMMKKNLSPTLRYAVMQGLLWANVAAISGYLNPYLRDRGIPVTVIGLLIALSSVGGALLQPLTGQLADRPGKPTLKQIMLGILGIFAVFASVTAALHRGGGLPLAIACCLSMLTWQLLTPLVNAAALVDSPTAEKPNFPVARGIGSITYAAVFFSMGQLIHGRTWLVPLSMLVLMVPMILTVLRYPLPESRGRQTVRQEKGGFFLMRYPRYCMILLGCLGVLIGHSVISHFAIQIVEAHGGQEPQMGAAMALACLMELPVMFGFGVLRKRFTALQMLAASSVFYVLKCIVTWVTTTMTGFYLVQLFQMPAFALQAVSAVLFISQEMAPEDAVKGQTWFSMATAAATILGSAVGGWLFDTYGMDALMRFATIASACGMAATFAALGMRPSRKSPDTP